MHDYFVKPDNPIFGMRDDFTDYFLPFCQNPDPIYNFTTDLTFVPLADNGQDKHDEKIIRVDSNIIEAPCKQKDKQV